ncbi:uncharacterized protein LAESUDRAFT_733357 [Laetiporus sulphureus 93-53]|uniref:MARVEL domain-containing protein n=1 Tax=Laetiporus sulphureus 93-53 TaxID=1314785 RepID=A0A165I8V8_9APHY|nr:uncharacterized protein LAESUDRAFT_733357 [Laetiporus sulphureus 93-53]KZT12744.1 hypothetical protein LAESUDRAFT_733357 [Laetiporus sulphureus 93-53]
MTQLFKEMRLYGFIAILLLSATVLGIAAYLGSIFLPNIQHDFGIFSLIVPSLTILVFLITVSWSSPRTEAIAFFILGASWLAMGAWSTDTIGWIQCDALGGVTRPTKNGGTISASSWCYEMKVIEAFSWMIFCLFAIYLWVLIALTSRARVLGHPYAWAEPIFELPWFGEFPGWPYSGGAFAPGQQTGFSTGAYMPVPYMTPMINGGYVVQQAPGHSVIVQPGAPGGPPAVTQVPGAVSTTP